MNAKYASINRMKEVMKEHGLKYLFLNYVILTTWPDDDRPYSIRELVYHEDTNELVAWQHWDQSITGFLVDYFKEETVLRIENGLNDTLKHINKYTVKITANIDVIASSPDNAIKTVNYMDTKDVKNGAYWFKAIDEVVQQ